VHASSSWPALKKPTGYLDEATRCYFYGLFTACAGLCRSVLEEALKQKLPAQLTRLIRTRYRNAATLGNLLHEVNNNLQGIDSGFPRVANRVNDTGKRAVHQGLLSEDEARECSSPHASPSSSSSRTSVRGARLVDRIVTRTRLPDL
jgi:hypothetical protein